MTIQYGRGLLAAALAGTALSGLATPAFAQAAAEASADDSTEIIVSARRRDESLQTTPVAVTAIQPSQL